MISLRTLRRVVTIGATVVGVLAANCPTVVAQYDVDEAKLTSREAARLSGSVRSSLRDAAAFADQQNRGKLDAYLDDYLFPTMTKYDPKSLGELGTLRQRFFRSVYWASEHQAVHEYLNEKTLAAMKRIATGNFNPANRYNAMLVIGRLDQQLGSDSGERRDPVPLPDTVDFMIEQLTQDSTADVVQIGAIIGLARHLRYGMAEDKRTNLLDLLLKVASADRPRSRSREGHGWIRALAAETLMSAGNELDESQVQDAFVKILRDDETSVANRSRVALSTGKLEEAIKENQQVDTTPFAAALSQLAVSVFEYEEKEAKRFVEGFLRGGGMLGPDGLPIEYPRERVLYRTYALQEGFKGIRPGLSDNVKAQVDQITEKLDQIYTSAADKKQVDQALTPLIERLAPEILEVARQVSGDPGDDAEVVDAEDVGL